jgi:uncharacterized membrane protein
MIQKGIIKMNTYNNELVMPKNYAVVNEEEMTYVDGGWCIERNWWGYNIYLTHRETVGLVLGTVTGAVIADLFSVGIAVKTLTNIAKSLKSHDNGYGVRVRMTGLTPTGVFSLSRSEEIKTASKNKII